MRKLISSMMVAVSVVASFAAMPEVTEVTAKQRYPWNGLVDITCKVTGINGMTNKFAFAVVAVMPDSGNDRDASHFWVVRGGTNSTDRKAHTNGDYRLVWDAKADLGQVRCNNMVVYVTLVKAYDKVQLWEGGPYWATMNIGAEEPWEYGYYFWWGDTIGYKRDDNTWVASDGSSSNFSFISPNTPTYSKSRDTLQRDGWISADDRFNTRFMPEHDAAHVHWGGDWRIPTYQEWLDLEHKCDWTWTTMNGVNGYIVRGKGDYSSASIFLPAAGRGYVTSLKYAGSDGYYWTPEWSSNNGNPYALGYYFDEDKLRIYGYTREYGCPYRPVQEFVE